jgi:hypothetical protein
MNPVTSLKLDVVGGVKIKNYIKSDNYMFLEM